MKKYLLAMIVILIAVNGFSQNLSIKDKESFAPLSYVTIYSAFPELSATTDEYGLANISGFKESDKIEIRLLGYETKKLSYQELESLNFKMFMNPSSISLNQFVVSASKWKQPKRNIPSKISVISPKDVSFQNPQTAADMLGISGEVFIQKSQLGGGSPMVRGFSTNRLLYTIDGVRMNTAIFRSGNLQNVISLDPFAMESSEVFFGPGSIVYGSDAIGAVMSFQTLAHRFTIDDKSIFNGSASTRYSSANNEKTGHFHLHYARKKVSSITSVTATEFGDQKMGTNGPDEYLRDYYVETKDGVDAIIQNSNKKLQTPTGYNQLNLMQKVMYMPNSKWSIAYRFHYSTTSDYARYDRLLRERNGQPRSAEWYYGPQIWMMNNVEISNAANNILYDDLTIRLAQQQFIESRHDRNFNDVIRSNRKENVMAYSANFDFRKSLKNNSELFYGAESVINDVTSTGFDLNIETLSRIDAPSRYPDAIWQSYAVYALHHQDLGKRFLLQTGIRYNYFLIDADFSQNINFYPFPNQTANLANGALTESLGLIFHPNPRWQISLNGSTGFRAPNIDDIGKVFDSEPGAVVIPNPDLKAEYAYNIEFDVAKIFNEFIKIDVTGFYTYLDNALVRRDFTLNGLDSIVYAGELSQVQAIQNAANATVYGFNAGIEIKLPYHLSLSSKFNYQKGEEALDDGTTSPSRHAAPWFGVTRLNFNKDKFTAQVFVTYNGQVSFENMPEEEKGKDYIYATDKNGNPYSPSWYTLNFKTQYDINKTFSVNLGLENITDQRYRPYSSGIVAPGRNLIISAKANF